MSDAEGHDRPHLGLRMPRSLTLLGLRYLVHVALPPKAFLVVLVGAETRNLVHDSSQPTRAYSSENSDSSRSSRSSCNSIAV